MYRNHPLFKVILVGAALLIFNAGYVNSTVLSLFATNTVSHMTGNFSKFGVNLIHGNYGLALGCILNVVFFLLGAMITGIKVKGEKFNVCFNYTIIFAYETFFFMSAFILFYNGIEDIGFYVLSMAFGMQNALVTKFSQAEIRTTHITGLLTDLGIELGHAIRKTHDVQWYKVQLFCMTLISFLLGCVAGTWFSIQYHFYALILPILITLFLALSSPLYKGIPFASRENDT